MGVSKDNGVSGGLVEVNDQLYECLTKHFRIFITGMKQILWSSISHNFIGGDYLFAKTLVCDGKSLETTEKASMIFVFTHL